MFEFGRLPDMREFWGLPQTEFAYYQLDMNERQELHNHMQSGKTKIIMSYDGAPPLAISEGQKLYWINYSDEAELHWGNWSHMRHNKKTLNAWRCVVGCPTTSSVWEHPW